LIFLHQIPIMPKTLLFKLVALSVFTLAFSGAAAAQETTQIQADRPVKITSVPKAEYTGDARKQMIEGWIKLRLTFLDTGELGDIFYVDESSDKKELTKAGLLKSAYDAAKKVTFEPAIRDGKPVTVTKIVLYSFALGQRGGGFQVGRGGP
jgi:Gram-negative bacterial TonB protein C-terminal